MFKQIKQIRIALIVMFKVNPGQAVTRNMASDTLLQCNSGIVWRLFILRQASLASCLVLCECATPDIISTLVNCNEVGSQHLP